MYGQGHQTKRTFILGGGPCEESKRNLGKSAEYALEEKCVSAKLLQYIYSPKRH